MFFLDLPPMAGDLSPSTPLSTHLSSHGLDVACRVEVSRVITSVFGNVHTDGVLRFGSFGALFFAIPLTAQTRAAHGQSQFLCLLGTRRITDTSTWSSSTRRPTYQEILDDTRLLLHGTGGPAGSRTCDGDSKLFYKVVVNTNLVGIISRTTLTSLTPQRRVPGNAAMFRECDFVSSIGNLYDHECPISCGTSPMDNENVTEDVPSYADVKQWGSDGHESGSAHFEQSVKSASQ